MQDLVRICKNENIKVSVEKSEESQNYQRICAYRNAFYKYSKNPKHLDQFKSATEQQELQNRKLKLFVAANRGLWDLPYVDLKFCLEHNIIDT